MCTTILRASSSLSHVPLTQHAYLGCVVRRNVLLVDIGVSIVAALAVLALTPGLAVAAPIAIAVLAACAVSLRRESRADRTRYRRRRR